MLVGRELERVRIDKLLSRARAGSGSSLIVRGEPGIGKTTLLRYAEEEAEGMRVLRARGVEAEADLPFSGLAELVRPLMGLQDALPEGQAAALRGVLGLEAQRAGKLLLGLATVSLLSMAAEERPLLCVVDDAHWLDVGSAEALVFAARRVEDDPIAFLFSSRVGEPRRFDAPGMDELQLAGLTRAEGRELLDWAGHTIDATVAQRLHEAVRGNPLALLELPPVLAEAQRAGAEPLTEPLPVTEAVQEAFARRIMGLPEETQRALVVAAAEPSGRSAPVESALAALGLALEALEPGEDEGLVDVGSGQVTFRHPLVRAAAYHAGRASVRRRAHRALAGAALESRDVDARAWHLAASAAGVDEEAAAALESVAERAKAQGTLVAASAAFERSAALSPASEQRARRLCRGARTYARIRGVRAFERGRAVVADALPLADDPALRAELGYWEAFFQIENDPRRAYDLLLANAETLVDVDPAFASLLAAEAGFVAHAHFGVPDLLAASAAARRHARRASARPDPYVVVMRALALIESGRLAAAAPMRAATDASIELLERVQAARADYTEASLPIYRWAAVPRAIILTADPQQLRRFAPVFEHGVALARPVGDTAALLTTSLYLGRTYYETGRWDDARASFAEGEGLARELGENARFLWFLVANLAELAAKRGLEGDCRAYADAAAAAAADTPYGFFRFSGVPGTGALGLLELGRGEYERAVDEYERVLVPSLGPFLLSHELADAIEAYVRVGRHADAQRLLAPYAAQARASGWAWACAHAAHLEMLLAHDDRLDEAFVAALAFHERAEQPFPRARTELAYGERLRRTGLRRRARGHLRAALEAFERLGATPWAEHAAAELRATGERVRRRSDPDTSQLTPQELQVALVVARGATNKEAAGQLYLSPKTIEKHLGSAYVKLGLRSRTELAGVLHAGAPVAAAV